MARGLIAGIVILVAVTLYSLFDCAARDSAAIRIMPKWGWLLVILFIPLIGVAMWFFFGRGSLGQGGTGGAGGRRNGPSAPDDDPDYLRRISDDLEQERRRRSHRDEESQSGEQEARDGDAVDRRQDGDAE